MEYISTKILIDDFKTSDFENYEWPDDEVMILLWDILKYVDDQYGIDFKVVKSKVKNLEGYHQREIKVKVKRLLDGKIFKFKMYDSGHIGEAPEIDEFMVECNKKEKK